ncbi:MAG: hypothetical protein ACRD4S_08945 [Candidatus Acidiferrales bacterium]
MNSRLRFWLITAAFLIFGASGARYTYAAPSAGGCALLTPAQIQKILGQPFSAPAESKAPPAYGQQPWGSHCEYASQKGPNTKVVFIVYEDASAPVAKQTFDKLSMWFAPKSKPSIGDSAYIDASHAIHVLKGKVRYYVSINPANEKQLNDLATLVAGRI